MKKVLLPALLALGMVALAHASAYAGNSVLLTDKGQITFPFSPPNQASSLPGAIDNTAIGQTTAALGAFTRMQLKTTSTVAALPTCNAAAEGTWSIVTDATTPTYNGALTGGGAVRVPVYCNGTAWTSH